MTRWLPRHGGALALTGVLTLTCALLITPATGAASGIVTKLKHAVDHLTGSSHSGNQSVSSAAAVGALFTLSNGKLSQHFCTASVVHSPAGDLALTAAHCVTGLSGTVAFVPDYHNGQTPYGIWQVTHIYTDTAWNSSQNPDDDFAFLTVANPSEGAPIEDITGAEELGTSPTSRVSVQVIGYPDGANEPVQCTNWATVFSPTQLEFDCDGYTDGTSGGPFLSDITASTGQGIVIGVIGGYEQGGDTPSVSYSSAFGTDVEALYKTAISAR